MDAQRWHDYCLSDPVPEPEVLTLRQWRHLTEVQRCHHIAALERWLDKLFLLTDDLAEIGQTVTDIVSRNTRTPPGAKKIVVITGPNLCGKSTMMMHLARELHLALIDTADRDPRGRPIVRLGPDSEADYCPIAMITLPARAQIAGVNRQVLGHYGVPIDGRGDLTIATIEAAKRHQTHVLIVDDTHLLYTDWKGGRFVLDHIKVINTALGEQPWGATLILVGANLAGSDLVRDPQIAGRLILREVPTYDLNESSSLEECAKWQRIAAQLEDLVLPYLPAGKPGMLYIQLAGELSLRTQGYIGDLVELIAKATVAASLDGSHRITKKHLDGVELSERAKEAYQAKLAEQRRRGRRTQKGANEDDGAASPSPRAASSG
ncbi:ATP-binding protein [Mycolicibacterium sp. CBMA 226]|uniref:ATP-binding protein n=1 Tax=Mycolicibacterium sp. CBMA 226 TaxID=2606611 RepID=UPI00130C28D0|nr:ATP-binding protein [Mycolicibacterium sp. CBMA 226]MUL74489.1 hypothetical protein [Mycolicibacterium sp. CBMA 226]